MRSVQTAVPVQVSTRRKHLAVPTEPMRSGCLRLAGHGSSDHRMRQALWCLIRVLASGFRSELRETLGWVEGGAFCFPEITVTQRW